MDAQRLANDAVKRVRELMSESTDSERDTLNAFSETFGAELEGWDMRIQEIGEEGGTPSR
jgi:hypothetical protein